MVVVFYLFIDAWVPSDFLKVPSQPLAILLNNQRTFRNRFSPTHNFITNRFVMLYHWRLRICPWLVIETWLPILMRYHTNLLLASSTAGQWLPHITSSNLLILFFISVLATGPHTVRVLRQLVKPIALAFEPWGVLGLLWFGLEILYHALDWQ